MPREARARFREQLAELESSALGGVDLVVGQLDFTLDAIEHQDIELAALVVDNDDRVDGRYLEVHQGVISLLALQAPVATDLRLAAALLHVVKHVERMGDQCVNVCKMLPLTGNDPPIQPEVMERVLTMGRHVRSEVCLAKRAFAERNAELAEGLVVQDRDVNRLNREIFSFAVERGDNADLREWLMVMTMIGRALERIGDNAVDIGEQAAFVVTGLFREFSDSSHPLPTSPP